MIYYLINSSSLGNNNDNNRSPRYERKRLPSLDGSTDSINVIIIMEIFLRK